MSINNFIIEAIIGTDSTLSMFDTSDHIYGTRNPSKSQRVAINRAIASVVDDINVVAIQSFDRANKIVFNPLSDKSTLIACEKRKSRDDIQYTDIKIWQTLGEEEDGQSFGDIDTRTKLLAAKARDPENAVQIEKDFEAEREAHFSARKSDKPKVPPPSIDDAMRALTILYSYARSVNSASDPDKGVEMEHDGNKLEFTITPFK